MTKVEVTEEQEWFDNLLLITKGENMADAVSTKDAVAKDGGKPIVIGNPDNWQLLTKFVSSDKSIAKSTKAMDLGHGCLVQVTTKEGASVAEALTYVPGVKIADDINGGRKLVSM